MHLCLNNTRVKFSAKKKFSLLCTNSFDYVKIIDDEGTVVGKFCGGQTGKILLLTGEFFSITFHSDYNQEERGFHITFTAVSFGT